MAIAAAARGGCARCASASRRATRTGSGATAGRYRPSRRGGQISSRARLDRPQGPQNATCGRVPSKKIQAKPRKNAWICLVLFVGIGTFQGVTANPNKKIFPGFDSPLGLYAKRASILLAARPILLRDGLGGTTLDRVAAEGGIAKMTLYRHFPSKEALFRSGAGRRHVQIHTQAPRERAHSRHGQTRREQARGRKTSRLRQAALIEPDALALYRLIVAEGWRFPELARVFDRSGMRVIRRRIAELLETGGVRADRSEASCGRSRGIGVRGCVPARNPRHC